MAWFPLFKAVELYFRHKGWATPKELINQLYPIFKRQYSDRETLRRNIHRILAKNKEIISHPLKPFYVYKSVLPHFNYLISHLAKTNQLSFLYEEGFEVLYEGDLTLKWQDIGLEEDWEAKLVLIPKHASKSSHYLLTINKIENKGKLKTFSSH